jgi:geranylgeranyl diphosphate synthase type II
MRAAILMAAHCSPSLDSRGLESLGQFGAHVGLAFQIQDDILDIEGDAALLGKPLGSDEARAMPTYPAIAGLDAARARVRELHTAAGALLDRHGWSGSSLAEVADWLLTRRH